ncbi:MAG: lipopolysaccharide heptosyltransferase II [candidate division Zixibacteria bacterium]|nr:lipopolysaccharide heptosyltransferase II [candidate division Zixibacteria bacterium]
MALDTPAVAGLMMAKPTKENAILVRSPNWVGDAVMALPFFDALRRAAPDATISCLCPAGIAPLYRDVPTIDRVLILDELYGPRGRKSVLYNGRRMRPGMFRTAFILPTSFGSALMMWHAWIPERIGYSSEGRRLLLSKAKPYKKDGKRPHRVEGYLELLRLQYPDADINPVFYYTPGENAQIRATETLEDYSLEDSKTILAMAPAAAQANKMWMQGRFAEIARRWCETTGGHVMLLGSPGDRQLCDQVLMLSKCDDVVNLAGESDLPTAGELVRRSAAFVGNDSGLAHLAAAVKANAVVLSGPGDPEEVGPYSNVAITIKHPLFCAPCYKNECWRTDKPIECLTEIDTDQVWTALQRFIPDTEAS